MDKAIKAQATRTPGELVASLRRSGGRGSIEIIEYSPRQTPAGVPARLRIVAGGALSSVILHTSFLALVLGNGGALRELSKPVTKPLAAEVAITDGASMELLSLDADMAANSRLSRVSQTMSPEIQSIRPTVDLWQPAEWFADDAIESPKFSPTKSDPFSAQLFGQYLGQIDARIDRAWLRPRTRIGADRFVCQLRIEQDEFGNVSSVVLEHCNGTPRWQLSLVHAIESASPLPAPSDPSVFTRSIRMTFQAGPIESAVNTAQYESEALALQALAAETKAATLTDLQHNRETETWPGKERSTTDLHINGQTWGRSPGASVVANRMRTHLHAEPDK